MYEKYYSISFGIGICIFALWVLVYLACVCWDRVWAWVDDSKVPPRTKIIEYIALKWGYQINPDEWSLFTYKSTSGGMSGDGVFTFVITGLGLALIPILILLTVMFYPVAIGIATFVVVAFMARFARRHKKLFDKHIVNKDAHK